MAADLNAELERVNQEIARLTVIRDYLTERAQNGVAPRRRRARTPQPGGRLTIAQAAEKVLSKSKEPMRTPALLEAVRAEGAQVADGDGLYKTLSRSAKFKKAGRGLWTLAS